MKISGLKKVVNIIAQKPGKRFVERPAELCFKPSSLKYVGDTAELGHCTKEITAKINSTKQEICNIINSNEVFAKNGFSFDELLSRIDTEQTPENLNNIKLLLQNYEKDLFRNVSGYFEIINKVLSNPEFYKKENQEVFKYLLERSKNSFGELGVVLGNKETTQVLVKLFNVNKTAKNPVLNDINKLILLSFNEEFNEARHLGKIFTTVDKNGKHIFNDDVLNDFIDERLEFSLFFNEHEDLICKEVFELIPMRGKKMNSSEVFDNILQKNPNISKEDFIKEARSILCGNFKIKNPKLKNLGLREDYNINELLYDIELSLGGFKDKKILSYIDKELKRIPQITSMNEKIGTLYEIRNLVESARIANGELGNLGRGYASGKYIDYLKANKKEAYIKIKEQIKANKDFDDIHSSKRFERLIDYCKNTSNKEIADYLYNAYYLKYANLPREVKMQLASINKEFNSKIFIPCYEERANVSKPALNFVEEEFGLWKKYSNNKAKYPKTLDFLSAKVDYIDSTSAYGQNTSGGYCNFWEESIAINKMKIFNLQGTLRHEMTHLNTTPLSSQQYGSFDMNKIFPKISKTINGKNVEVPDVDNCPYIEELINAGLSKQHAAYGYNNYQELLAVASEVEDMNVFSAKFKSLLKEFGMNEYQFNMPHPKIPRPDRVSEIPDDIYMAGTKLTVDLLIKATGKNLNKDQYDCLVRKLYDLGVAKKKKIISENDFDRMVEETLKDFISINF